MTAAAKRLVRAIATTISSLGINLMSLENISDSTRRGQRT